MNVYTNIDSIQYFIPEIAVIGFILLIVLLEVAPARARKLIGTVTFWGLLIVAGLVAAAISTFPEVPQIDRLLQGEFGPRAGPYNLQDSGFLLFEGAAAYDQFSLFFKLGFVLATALVVAVSGPIIRRWQTGRGEFYALLMSCLLGMMLMASARSLLMMYLALEFASVTSYIMAGMLRRNRKSAEAALKYIIFGGAASGVMIFGMGYLYGVTGSLEIGEIGQRITELFTNIQDLPEPLRSEEKTSFQLMSLVISVLVMTGFGYKIAAVPFHMWCPDVYEGAPTPITAFFSVGPKAAGFAMLIRFVGGLYGVGGYGVNEETAALTIAPAGDGSGAVYVGGSFTSYDGAGSNRIIRLSSDGTVDAGVFVGDGFDGRVHTIAAAGDGTGAVYVGGSFTRYDGTESNRIIRLNSDGTVDAGFVVGAGFNGNIHTIAAAGDGTGDVYVGGDFTTYDGMGSNRIIRLNSDGTLDADFAVGTGFAGRVQTIAAARDGTGDAYVGGGFTSYDGTGSNRIIRLNSDGTVDAGFDVGDGFSGRVQTIAPAGDDTGDVYIGGYFTSYDGTGSNRIIRLNSDGTVDAAFVVGEGLSGRVQTIAAAGDGTGDVYVGGSFTTYKETGSNRIIRLKSDGTVDAGFAVGAGFDSTIWTIAAAGDGTGDVFVGDFFTTHDGKGSNRIIRLNSNGTVDAGFDVGAGFGPFDIKLIPFAVPLPELIAILALLAVLTMAIGNFVAIQQSNLKRLLAYSSIAHAGYMLLAFTVFTPENIASLMFYVIVYIIMNLGAFFVVIELEERYRVETVEGCRGLGFRAPALCALMVVFLVSLAGLPPTAGFIGKLLIFGFLVKTSITGDYFGTALAFVGVLFSAVSLYYYARIMIAMYLHKPAENPPAPKGNTGPLMPVIWMLAAATLILGILWEPLYSLALKAARGLL